VIKFGPDGKLYLFIGDVGRRGWMQNLLNGPYQPGDPAFGTDDNFGGPEPDDAHLTGVILRLNDDGTAPADNPFREVGHVFVARLEGSQEVPANASTAKGIRGVFPKHGDDVLVVHGHRRRPRFYGLANRRPGR
jgi:glucose/arabinose dehydrogenase